MLKTLQMILLSILAFAWANASELASGPQKSQSPVESTPTANPSLPSTTFSLSLGNYSESLGAAQINPQGDTNNLNWNPYFSLSYHYLPHLLWPLSAELGLNWPREPIDRSVKRWSGFLRATIGHRWHSLFTLHLGTGLFINHLQGQGGRQDLRNGGTNNRFFNPSQNTTSVVPTWDVGGEIFLHPQVSLKFFYHTSHLFDEIARQHDFSMSLSFYFHQLPEVSP